MIDKIIAVIHLTFVVIPPANICLPGSGTEVTYLMQMAISSHCCNGTPPSAGVGKGVPEYARGMEKPDPRLRCPWTKPGSHTSADRRRWATSPTSTVNRVRYLNRWVIASLSWQSDAKPARHKDKNKNWKSSKKQKGSLYVCWKLPKPHEKKSTLSEPCLTTNDS